MRAAAGDLVLLVGTDRNVASPGKPFQVTARALDLDGNELKGVPITLKATRIIAEKKFGHMVALRPPDTVAVPLAEATGRLRTVAPDGDMVQTARALGISFGD